MTQACKDVGGINLSQGTCDFPTPAVVRDAAMQALAEDHSSYSSPRGIPELRNALATKLERDNGIVADPESEILVTAGATGAFLATINSLLSPGDGVMLFEPYYGYHRNSLIIEGLEPQIVPLSEPDFTVDIDAVRAGVRENTRAILVCTPANPSGKVFSERELRELGALTAELGLYLITDETYEYLVYDGHKHLSAAALPENKGHTITVLSFSKTFSVTGWRVGGLVAPREIASTILLSHDVQYICAPTPLQHGVLSGLGQPPEYFTELSAAYQKRRDKVCDALAAAGMEPVVPAGAYYILADISSWDYETSDDAALGLLDRAGVASVPGSAFFVGPNGNNYLRFCFAKPDNVLDEACRRLREM